MLRHALVVALIGCSGSAQPTGPAEPPPAPAATEYRASIRWTEYGIPHVLADDLGSVAFGQGYAFAAQHGCLLAERIVVLRSQRARFFGAGDDGFNLDSDFAYLSLGLVARAREALPTLSADIRAVAAGFAAGYNKRLADSGFTGFCRGAPWLSPITDVEVLAHGLDASIVASSRAFGRNIGNAHPHRAGDPAPATGALPALRDGVAASNAWAIGAERSASGHGMLVANPHFPWTGPLTFYESHLTVPGVLDAYGATLMGLPLLTIAFNRDVAWTHTFSDAVRFAIYRLPLDPADPTRYLYDGKPRAMTSKSFTVQVKQADGSLADVSRTMWRSHYGPMLDGGALAWDAAAGQAFTLRDAAFESPRGLDLYLDMMRARSVGELRAAVARHQTMPYANIIATDRVGDVFYADGSRVPNLSPQALMAWRLARRTMPPVQQAWESGVVALDGSLPLFEWVDDPTAGAPGVIPFSAAPQLVRRDFVFNANDSAWIANPAQPLTAQSPLYGDVEVPLSPRSRMNLKLLTETGAGAASGADGRFDLDELERAILSNRVFTAELLADAVVARCRAGSRGKPWRPCETLAAWDRRVDLDSKGALLWREYLGRHDRKDYYSGAMFATPFDPARPLETPAGLPPAPAGKPDPVVGNLGVAVHSLGRSNIDAGARLGDHQFTEIGGQRFPVHGGPELEGTTNQTQFQPQGTMAPGMSPGTMVVPRTGLSDRGYPVNYGTSFLLVLAFGDDGPQARGLMTYGSSSDPASPDATAQMALWSRKQLRRMRFTEADIRADPKLRVDELRAPR